MQRRSARRLRGCGSAARILINARNLCIAHPVSFGGVTRGRTRASVAEHAERLTVQIATPCARIPCGCRRLWENGTKRSEIVHVREEPPQASSPDCCRRGDLGNTVVCRPMHRCRIHGPFGASPNARGICLTNESVLQSSTQHNVTPHFGEILDPDRRIAIVIGHEEACGIRDRAPGGRAGILAPSSRALRILATIGRRGLQPCLDMATASA